MINGLIIDYEANIEGAHRGVVPNNNMKPIF